MRYAFNIHREEVARVEIEAESQEQAAEQIAKAIEEGRDSWEGWEFLKYEAWNADGDQMVECTTWSGVTRMF